MKKPDANAQRCKERVATVERIGAWDWPARTGYCERTDRKWPKVVLAIVGVFGIASLSIAGTAEEGIEFFEKQVRPILAGTCQECHGSKKQESSLRLDSRAAALKGGDHGPAVVPGDVKKSLLISAVRHEGDLQMPPEKKLDEKTIAALVRWVEIGAPWPESTSPPDQDRMETAKHHWAFQPVSDPPIPSVENTRWPNGPIDAFVLARLESEKLPQSPETDRRTLYRRLSFDLTGLPPTYEEVSSFERDSSPDAYERLVDRLLASPHYGEAWARHWLDVARYSDTKGYVYAREERFWIHAWVYRDWVARALNEDLPYDRFVLLQLAADQVADADRSSLAAMGYLTLGRRFLGVTHDIIDDRIDVVTRGMLGMTVACARCHDHKFDPIPTRDYYSLYGVFKNCAETVTRIGDPPREDSAFAKGLHERETKLRTALAGRRAEAADRARAKIADYFLAQTEMHKYPEEGFDQVLEPGDVIPATVRRWREFLHRPDREQDPVFAAWWALSRLPDEGFAEAAQIVCRVAREGKPAKWNPLVAKLFERPVADMRDVAVRYGDLFASVDRQWRQTMEKAKSEKTPPPSGLEDADAEAIRRVMYREGSPCEPPDEPIVGVEFYVPTDVTVQLWGLQGEVDRWLIRQPDAPAYVVQLVDRPNPSNAHVFRRGNPANVGDETPRQFLEAVAGAERKPFEHGSGRLDLAKAIVEPTNPLTSRVMVNRVWQHHFGAGIVRTPSDFGTRAEPPSHPELLDWLAKRFVEECWSIKRLHRMIVTSASYRQSSVGPMDKEARTKAVQRDPENRLLWRTNVRRLGFEETRDSLVAAAGELDDSIGGKPVELFTSPYPRRRTLYGLVDREFFPSVLRVFDFANPDLHIPQRTETIVPQQALFFLNHESLLEWANRLVQSASGEDPSHWEARIQDLYRRVYQRNPTTREMELALGLMEASAADAPPAARETAADWAYGYGEFEPVSGELKGFQKLPHFTSEAWQGGANWPDATLGWVRLTAEGGHAGNDLKHAAVRRWTAPHDAIVTLRSLLKHSEKPGDGVRGSIVSSRHGLLRTTRVHRKKAEMNVDSIEVKAGDTLDFVVDLGDNLNSDDFVWGAVVTEKKEGGVASRTWSSREDFGSQAESRLDPWQQLAQVLLLANEFVFVD